MAKKLPAKKIPPKPSPPKKVPPKKRAPTPKKTGKTQAIKDADDIVNIINESEEFSAKDITDELPFLSEVEESAYTLESLKDDISISDPTPRADPNPKPATDIERLFNIKWSKYIPRVPTPKQLAALMLQDVKELLYGGALGGGKFVGEEDSILTPTGFKRNTQLQVGDNISNPDGTVSTITQWKGWEELECYKVTFHDDTSIEVPLTHLWSAWRSGRSVKANGIRYHGQDSAQVVDTITLLRWHQKALQSSGKVSQTPWVLIPVSKPIEFTNKWSTSIDPYLLGALLGDGYIGGVSITLTCSADDYENHWKYLVEGYATTTDTKNDGNKTIRFVGDSLKLIKNCLKLLNLNGTHSHTKFIPQELLYTPIADRTALFQGLMDTYGYVDARGQLYYCSVSPQLRADVCTLVGSLGGVATEFDTNELYIKLPDEIVPCRLNRKVNRLRSRNCTIYKKVKSIKKSRVKKGRCVSVANPNGLYITNGFIVTHNSDFLAYEALRFCDMPGFASIVFRRQLTDLKQPGSLMPRVAEWLEPFRSSGEARYVAQDHCWHFKTRYPGTDIPGAEALLQWGYIGDAAIRERYQSAEYQLVEFDELGQWSDSTDWTFMGSRIRATVCPIHKKDGNGVPIWHDDCHICSVKRRIPLRKRAAMNPGPAWVKRYFQIVPDPKVYKTRQAALIAMQEGEKINWVGIHPERKFIPAYLNDNPHLDGKDYKVMLAQMTEDERSRLEDGNWESRKNARFKRKWINGQYINVYDHGYSFLDVDMQESIILPFSSLKTIFTTTDAAATARLFVTGDDEAIAAADGRVSSKPSSTCIGVWGVTYTNQLLWLDFYKFRKELPTIVETLVDVNIKWKPSFNKIEANGLGIGVAQYSELAGLPVRKNTRKKDKLENSLSAQMMMKNGQIYMAANTPWAETAEDDIFNWTGLPDEEDDTVDILADAALEITPTMASKISLPMRRPAMPSAVSTTRGGGMIPTYGLPGSH